MKKTVNINLGGLLLAVDEDAFARLSAYLRALEVGLGSSPETAEILADVESRMAELLKEGLSPGQEVVNRAQVEAVIAVMGAPEDYLSEENASSSKRAQQDYQYHEEDAPRKLFRDPEERMIGGVAAGLAAYFRIEVLWIRLLFIALIFAGFGILLYLILWVVIPAAQSTAQKLQMRGKPVTLSNIEAFVRSEAEAVGQQWDRFSTRAQDYDYGSASQGLTRFFRRLFDAIGQLLSFLLRALGKFFSLLLLLLGGLLLFALLGSLLWGVNINGQQLPSGETWQYLQSLMGDPNLSQTFILGLSLLFLAPIMFLLFWALRLLFGLAPLQKGVRQILLTGATIGLIISVVSIVRLAIDFSETAYHREQVVLIEDGGKLHLAAWAVPKSAPLLARSPIFEAENALYYSQVQLYIEPSPSERSFLQLEAKAQGSSRGQAQIHAAGLRYPWRQKGDSLLLSPYFSLAPEIPYRLQRQRLYLYIAEGDSLQVERGLEGFLREADNRQNYAPSDMGSYLWQMQEGQLQCLNCPDS